MPLWKSTAAQLRRWLPRIDRSPDRPVFPNRTGQPLSRSVPTAAPTRLVRCARRRRLSCRIGRWSTWGCDSGAVQAHEVGPEPGRARRNGPEPGCRKADHGAPADGQGGAVGRRELSHRPPPTEPTQRVPHMLLSSLAGHSARSLRGAGSSLRIVGGRSGACKRDQNMISLVFFSGHGDQHRRVVSTALGMSPICLAPRTEISAGVAERERRGAESEGDHRSIPGLVLRGRSLFDCACCCAEQRVDRLSKLIMFSLTE